MIRKQQTSSLMLLILYGMLIAALLLLTIGGARCYASVVHSRNQHMHQRSSLSFIQTQVSSCGGRGNVYLAEGPEGTMVCLKDSGTDYETRVFLSEGGLYTEFARSDAPVNMKNAQRLCDEDSFEAYWSSEELLHLAAGGYSAEVWCPGGGGDER